MKLPQNHVAGEGLVKATACGGVGQRLMEKLGWRQGKGLGREEAGMREALEVKEKKNQSGVGANSESWDWGHKFWEDAYNTVAVNIEKEGDSDSSDSSNSSSSSDSDSESESGDETEAKKRSPNKGASSSSPSSLTSPAAKKSKAKTGSKATPNAAVHMHRDGSLAGGATKEELAIASELSKDPWGRWGGKAGKMARIRHQEEEEAAAARLRLSTSKAYALRSGPGATASTSLKTDGNQTLSQDAKSLAVPAPPRLVITLKVEDNIQRGSFKRTPPTGWWGAASFTSAGALEGMEEATEAKQKQRTTFNEDDQAALYMKAHDLKTAGHKGLGRSTTLKIEGGTWKGTKMTFAEEGVQGVDDSCGVDADSVAPICSPEEEEEAACLETGKGKRGLGAAEVEDPAASKARKRKKNRGGEKVADSATDDQEDAGGEGGGSQQVSQPSTSGNGQVENGHGGILVTPCTAKWLKVVKSILKQAPGSQLKMKKLCKHLLEHLNEQHHLEVPTTGNGSAHSSGSLSKLHVKDFLQRKAEKKKVVIADGYVRLP